MGMDSFGGRQDMKSDINVTPLVDVCLVLLIIFMVVTPMLQSGVDVLLPEGPHAAKKPGKEGRHPRGGVSRSAFCTMPQAAPASDVASCQRPP